MELAKTNVFCTTMQFNFNFITIVVTFSQNNLIQFQFLGELKKLLTIQQFLLKCKFLFSYAYIKIYVIHSKI